MAKLAYKTTQMVHKNKACSRTNMVFLPEVELFFPDGKDDFFAGVVTEEANIIGGFGVAIFPGNRGRGSSSHFGSVWRLHLVASQLPDNTLALQPEVEVAEDEQGSRRWHVLLK